jgi:hypothetical protein
VALCEARHAAVADDERPAEAAAVARELHAVALHARVTDQARRGNRHSMRAARRRLADARRSLVRMQLAIHEPTDALAAHARGEDTKPRLHEGRHEGRYEARAARAAELRDEPVRARVRPQNRAVEVHGRAAAGLKQRLRRQRGKRLHAEREREPAHAHTSWCRLLCERATAHSAQALVKSMPPASSYGHTRRAHRASGAGASSAVTCVSSARFFTSPHDSPSGVSQGHTTPHWLGCSARGPDTLRVFSNWLMMRVTMPTAPMNESRESTCTIRSNSCQPATISSAPGSVHDCFWRYVQTGGTTALADTRSCMTRPQPSNLHTRVLHDIYSAAKRACVAPLRSMRKRLMFQQPVLSAVSIALVMMSLRRWAAASNVAARPAFDNVFFASVSSSPDIFLKRSSKSSASWPPAARSRCDVQEVDANRDRMLAWHPQLIQCGGFQHEQLQACKGTHKDEADKRTGQVEALVAVVVPIF